MISRLRYNTVPATGLQHDIAVVPPMPETTGNHVSTVVGQTSTLAGPSIPMLVADRRRP